MYNEYSIDETMVAYRGRLGIRQYLPSKPVKYGIKIYALANSSNGYVRKWLIYTGRKFGGASPLQVFQEFIEVLPLYAHLFFDSHFSSKPVFDLLIKRNFFFTASIRKGRKNFPPLPTKKEKQKENDSIFYNYENLFLVHFKSKKNLIICSNYYRADLILDNNIMKPEMVYNYNLKARGVDKNNQLSSYYYAGRKSIKWYRKLFFMRLKFV